MESGTVEAFVNELATSFETGLQFYTQWRRTREKSNHYRKPGSISKGQTGNCSLATSLGLASRLRETYEVGYAIIGADFAAGDSKARRTLSAQGGHMKDQVTTVRNAMTSGAGALDINAILQVSETARISSIEALSDLYQSLAIGRPVPRDIPVPKWRSPSRETARPGSPSTPTPLPPPPPPQRPAYPEYDAITVWSKASGPLLFQSEPPSPPLTPKLPVAEPDDADSRPRNSVFSIFCPEAMALQVDTTRPVPTNRKCKCGFRWRVPELPEGKDAVLLKDGFSMTRRFLAKSHCEGRRGYGCVLCTSCGKTETYETAEHLRVHVNVAHSKWQMLHDRDMT